MPLRDWLRPPRYLLALFLAVTVVPATALAWLSWRILEQDRALETQRVQERLDHAADLIAAALERRLAEVEEQLPALAASSAHVPDDALIVTLGEGRVEANPEHRLLYQPFVPPTQEPSRSVWEAGEILEFQREDYSAAIVAFRDLARSKDLLIRAGALVRLARNLRKSDRHEDALAVYEDLAGLGPVPVGNMPAELLARQARCTVLAEVSRLHPSGSRPWAADLQQAATDLHADIQRGHFKLDRASYEFHSQAARAWLTSEADMAPNQDALALAAAVESLWRDSQDVRRAGAISHGRQSVWVHGRSVLVIWRASSKGLVALVAGPSYVTSEWQSAWEGQRVAIDLTDPDGHRVFDRPIETAKPQAIRAATDTRLPWTIRVASASPNADLAELAGRRRLLLMGLALMAFLVLAGSYFVGRAATRELAVARLQSDFVSAVSHEFRTPLTSMRHLTELLVGDVVPTDARRRQYYVVLARETERLHRLVESLLNFGRMEAGALEYRFEPLDPAALVEDVVTEFRAELVSSGHQIELGTNGALPPIRGDREALGRALWNVLDNAVKYSPDLTTIRIEMARKTDHVAIRVLDRGVGIPPAEQQEIFRKFVRGAASKASSVKGTGIGLAMVQHIVGAHGGHVELESEPGRGSTFTILLPTAPERAEA